MTNEQILKVLKNERECIARQNGKCDRNYKECDLCLPDDKILAVYDFLIGGYESMTDFDGSEIKSLKVDISKLSQEEYQRLIDGLKGIKAQPVSAIGIDIYGKEHFKGICPYINNPCEKWTCGACKIEERERKFAEGET